MSLLSELIMPVTHTALTEVAGFCIPHRLYFSARKVVFGEFAHTPRTISHLACLPLNTSPEEATKLLVSGGSTDLSTGGIIVKIIPNTASSPQQRVPILYTHPPLPHDSLRLVLASWGAAARVSLSWTPVHGDTPVAWCLWPNSPPKSLRHRDSGGSQGPLWLLLSTTERWVFTQFIYYHTQIFFSVVHHSHLHHSATPQSVLTIQK